MSSLIDQVTRQGIVSWVEKSHPHSYPIDSIVDVDDSKTVRIVIKVPASVNRHKKLRVVSLRWAFAPEALQFNAYCIVQGAMLAGESIEDRSSEDKRISRIMFKKKISPLGPVQLKNPEKAPLATKWRLTPFPQNAESDVLAVIRLEVIRLAEEHIPPDVAESLEQDETLILSPVVLSALGVDESPTVVFEYVFKVDNMIGRRKIDPSNSTEVVTDRRRTKRKPRLYYEIIDDSEEEYVSPKRQRQTEAGPSRSAALRVPDAIIAAADGQSEDVDINKFLDLIEEEKRLNAQVGSLYATKRAKVEKLREVAKKLGLKA